MAVTSLNLFVLAFLCLTEVLLRDLTTAMTEGDADWLRRYAWFLDLVTAMLEDAAGKRLDE
jgi:hypothetical protein